MQAASAKPIAEHGRDYSRPKPLLGKSLPMLFDGSTAF